MVRVVSRVLVPFMQRRGFCGVSAKVEGIHSSHLMNNLVASMTRFVKWIPSETSLTLISTLTVMQELIA